MQTVTVTKTETRQGKQGPYTIAFLEGGQRAYVWDKALAQSLAPGLYEAELEERGGFLRIKSARPIASSNGAQEAQEARHPQEASAQERLEALRVVLTLAQWTRLESVDQALAAADKVLCWLRGGGEG
jgi:hypothetical protein